MENLLTLLIILIFIFRGLSKLMENVHREEEKEKPSPEEWKQYFERIGIPPLEKEKEALPPPPTPAEAKKVEVRHVPLKTKIKKEKAPSQLPPLKIPSLSLDSLDKLKEGIVLSEILGPPRAKKIKK